MVHRKQNPARATQPDAAIPLIDFLEPQTIPSEIVRFEQQSPFGAYEVLLNDRQARIVGLADRDLAERTVHGLVRRKRQHPIGADVRELSVEELAREPTEDACREQVLRHEPLFEVLD